MIETQIKRNLSRNKELDRMFKIKPTTGEPTFLGLARLWDLVYVDFNTRTGLFPRDKRGSTTLGQIANWSINFLIAHPSLFFHSFFVPCFSIASN